MEMYADAIENFGGAHFLSGMNMGSPDPDDDSNQSSYELEEIGGPQPKRFCAPLNWSSEEINTIKPFPFTGDSGIRMNLGDPKPIDVFSRFFNPDFLNTILVETNLYAKRLACSPDSTFSPWRSITMTELSLFLGLTFHTGTIRISDLADYWTTHKLYDLKAFRTRMTLNRFSAILTALRFGRGSRVRTEKEHERSSIDSLISYFNAKMESIYYPGRELVIDDCMTVTRDAVTFKHSVNSQFKKTYFNLHSLSEPNGLVLKVVTTDGPAINYPAVVSALVDNKKWKGHSLYLGPDYTDVSTVHEMILNQTYCTGVFQPNNESIPDELQYTDAKVTKYGIPAMLFCDPGICVLKWKGREEVTAISSEFKSHQESLTGENDKCKPLMITEYRKLMTEVDRRALAMAYTPFDGQDVGWYTSVGIHFFQIMMKNAHILYSNHVQKLSLREFRMSVIDSLLSNKEPAPDIDQLAKEETVDSSIHVPKKFPKRPGQRALRKRCKICLRKGKRTDSYYHCAQCPELPALCLEKCFAAYHKGFKVKFEQAVASKRGPAKATGRKDRKTQSKQVQNNMEGICSVKSEYNNESEGSTNSSAEEEIDIKEEPI